jgi:hypothetical protein
MLPTQNNLIIIDCWDHLTHDLEIAAKHKIRSLLSQIESKQNWNVYVWNGVQTPDQQIYTQLVSGDFNLSFDFSDPLTLFNGYHMKSPVSYYFCGFHANHCIFYNTVGVEKYFQIADTTRSRFWIINDATVALDRGKACQVDDLPWYNADQIDECQANILNYRKYILQNQSCTYSMIFTKHQELL